jgi:hypothetical protein
MAMAGAISKYEIDNFTLYILEILHSEISKEIISERENY